MNALPIAPLPMLLQLKRNPELQYSYALYANFLKGVVMRGVWV